MKQVYSWLTACLCLLLTACVAEDLQGPVAGEGEGYLVLQLGPVSADVQSSPLTKNMIYAPAYSGDFHIRIINSKTQTAETETTLSIGGNQSFVLPVGNYIIEAFSDNKGENIETNAIPYYTGKGTVEVKPNSSTPLTVTAQWGYSMISPSVQENLTKHYQSYWLRVTSNDGSKDIQPTNNGTFEPFYILGETNTTVSLTGTNYVGKNVSHVLLAKNPLPQATEYAITVTPNIPTFSFPIVATATHTKNAGYLDGTKVELTLNDLSEIPTGLITAWAATLTNSAGVTVRSYSANSNPSQGTNTMSVSNDWPYLPQGNYSLSYTYTLDGAVYNSTENISVTVPAPEFEVEVSAYTSYDKYLENKIEEANNCDAETIYGIQATAKIADALLSNSHYSHAFTLALDDTPIGSSNTSAISTADQTGLSWAAHTLKASMTFDGTEIVKERVHHITGLPYTLIHPANNYGWYTISGTDVQFNDNYVLLATGGGAPSIGSKSFHIIDTIDFILTCNYTRNRKTSATWTLTIKLYDSINKKEGDMICSHTHSSKESFTFSGDEKFFTKDYCSIYCHYNYGSYLNNVNINSISILYR